MAYNHYVYIRIYTYVIYILYMYICIYNIYVHMYIYICVHTICMSLLEMRMCLFGSMNRYVGKQLSMMSFFITVSESLASFLRNDNEVY